MNRTKLIAKVAAIRLTRKTAFEMPAMPPIPAEYAGAAHGAVGGGALGLAGGALASMAGDDDDRHWLRNLLLGGLGGAAGGAALGHFGGQPLLDEQRVKGYNESHKSVMDALNGGNATFDQPATTAGGIPGGPRIAEPAAGATGQKADKVRVSNDTQLDKTGPSSDTEDPNEPPATPAKTK